MVTHNIRTGKGVPGEVDTNPCSVETLPMEPGKGGASSVSYS
jgi:hypothetical protein